MSIILLFKFDMGYHLFLFHRLIKYLILRKYIYTNIIVESVNSKIQREFYGRGTLPNAGSAINIIYVNLIDLEKKWAKTKVANRDKIFNEIQLVHKNIIEQYII